MRKSKRTFRMFVEEELGGFPHFVVWAVLEWMLIISLYLDGFLAFISNKFADIFELDPPCVLCTRVDHALGGKNSPTSYYSDSICDSHKKDISSLAYCHVHRKLSDIRTMCDGCLLSLSTEKESASDNHNKDQKMFAKPSEKKLTDNNKNDNAIVDTDRCSCCGESLKPKQPSKELSRNFSNLRASSQIPPASPRASGLFPTSSPRASSLFPSSSPRASLMFPTSSPRASSSLFPNSSPRAFSSLFPSSSPRASSSLFPASSPRFSSLAPMASPRAAWRIEEAGRNSELSQARYTELRFVSDNEPDIAEYDFGMNTNAKHYEEMNENAMKTPSHIRGNKFFGVSFAESIESPRWAHKPPKKAPLEKSDLFSETTDESPADGGSILQQLKKQVSDNRKTLVTLYLELDEERCAAAVAANNAMAMITRLQAEKAAVHMEALQYQRMMDEQAEYDEEAIQILRDLYLKKEEDVKVLETEVDVYRARYGEIKKMDSDEYDEYYDEFHPRSVGDRSEFKSVEDDQSVDGNRKGTHEETSGNFETERSHLFGMLKEFENHVRSSSQREDQELEDRDTGDNASFMKEVNLMREKLAVIEAESGFLKQTAMTLEKGDEGTKILTEIAQHLRKLNS
ncbi:unnamed protein product [Lactuca virosa]|uniref:GTD-binding domain-containing protein n=1 Tax=Lactuca virosa TaxID=75947 RepID=A0AAU9NYM7_9ASTR|nr:unnamed protein product [Lactuca virosa]